MKHTAHRILLWLCASLCLLLAAHSQAATRKYVTQPSTQAVLTSSNTSYLSQNNLWVKGDTMTSYIDRVGKKTPIGGVVPKKAFSVPSIAGRAKSLLKGNLAQVALSAAISGMIAAVGWVMDEGTVVKKVAQNAPADDPNTFRWNTFTTRPYFATPTEACNDWMTSSVDPRNSLQSVTKVSSLSYNCVILRYSGGTYTVSAKRSGTTCPATYTYDVITDVCTATVLQPLTDADLAAVDTYVTTQNSEWLRDLLRGTCTASNNPAQCYAELQVAAQQLEGPATVEGGVVTKTSTYTRPDGTMGTRTEQEHTNFGLNYGPDYFDYTTTVTTTTTEDGTQTGQTTQTDTPDVTQEEPKDDQQDQEEEKPPERVAAGDACDAPLTCSGDAIDCAVLTQDKALRCAYEKQSDYDQHKDEIKTAVTGDKFEIDDSTEVEIPSFINQGTRFLPASCPADKSFSLQTGGGRTFMLTYGPLCSLATDLGYLIVIAVGCFCVLYVGRSLGGE